MSAAIDDLTPLERFTLSSSICGNVEAARSLEKKGLVRDVRLEFGEGGDAYAFFRLTCEGKRLHDRHFVIDPKGVSDA